jgi:glycosyltransferase involved in cell wall biosynthesis
MTIKIIEVAPGGKPVFGETGADAVSRIIKGLSTRLCSFGNQVVVIDIQTAVNQTRRADGCVEIERVRNPFGFMVRKGSSTGAGSSENSPIPGFVPSIWGFAQLFYFFFAALKVASLSVRMGQLTIVHVHSPWQTVLLACERLILNLKFRLVYTTHNHSVLMPTFGLVPSFGSVLQEYIAIKMCDHVVTPTQPVAERLTRMFKVLPSKVSWIPYGVDNSLDHAKLTDEDLERTDILYVARIQRRKNQMLILRALEVLKNEGITPEFTMVGPVEEATYLDELMRFVEEKSLNVKLVGEVSDERLRRFYLGALLVVIPSIQETQGLVLFDAMAFGKPVIASKIEPFISLTKEEQNCLKLVEPNDLEGWVNDIKELLSDSALREKLGTSARSFVVAKYTADVTARRYSSLFDELSQK